MALRHLPPAHIVLLRYFLVPEVEMGAFHGIGSAQASGASRLRPEASLGLADPRPRPKNVHCKANMDVNHSTTHPLQRPCLSRSGKTINQNPKKTCETVPFCFADQSYGHPGSEQGEEICPL